MAQRARRFDSKSTALQTLEGVDLSGKTYAVTGTTSGIGTETVKALISHGAHVVMINRNVKESEKLKTSLLVEKPSAQVDIVACDLSSLQSVEKAGKEYLEKGWPLHGLILNAGVMKPSFQTTTDGFEAHYGINHLAHFVLLRELLPVLRSSAPSRVVILTSDLSSKTCVKQSQPIEKKLKILLPEDASHTWLSKYANSKMCNILTAFKLHRDEYSKGISAYSVHPGVVKTGLQRDFPGSGLISSLGSLFMKTPEQGAATSVYCATNSEVKDISGKYWADCWDDEGGLDKKVARDEQLQDAVWKQTNEVVDRALRSAKFH